MKKLLSLLLTLAMVMGMTITGFADPATYTITVPDTDSHSYSVYQIFTGDLSGDVLSNVKWGQNGTGTVGADVADEVLNALTAVNSKTDTEKLAVINNYANLTGDAYGTVTKDAALTGVPAGYYLIKDKDAITEKGDAATLYIVKIVGDTTIARKADKTTVDKVIVDNNQEMKVNEASIGDTVNYKFTGTLPERLSDYNTYFYKFTDTLSKGLTVNANSFKVEVVNGTTATDVTTYFYKGIGEYSATAGTTIEVSIQDLLALNKVDGVKVDKDTKVVVTYSAVLNKDAVIAGTGNDNTVKLTYSNNPNDSGTPSTTPPSTTPTKPETTKPTGETPDSTVRTYTTELTILKTNDEDKFLPGTEFTLTGNQVNVGLKTTTEFVVDAAGTYYQLKGGTYTETAPTADSYLEKTAGTEKVVATAETPIYTKNEDGTYTSVSEVAANATYYVFVKGNTDSYEDVNTKYKKETTIVPTADNKGQTSVVGVVGADGKVTFKGLGAGTYTLTETKTLPGYNTISPIEFTVGFNKTDATYTSAVTFTSDNSKIQVQTDNTLYSKIINKSGSVLPTTGGMGTTLFYLVGIMLILGAGVLLFTRKRMAK